MAHTWKHFPTNGESHPPLPVRGRAKGPRRRQRYNKDGRGRKRRRKGIQKLIIMDGGGRSGMLYVFVRCRAREGAAHPSKFLGGKFLLLFSFTLRKPFFRHCSHNFPFKKKPEMLTRLSMAVPTSAPKRKKNAAPTVVGMVGGDCSDCARLPISVI